MESKKLRHKDGRRKTAQLRPEMWQKQGGQGGRRVLGGPARVGSLQGMGRGWGTCSTHGAMRRVQGGLFWGAPQGSRMQARSGSGACASSEAAHEQGPASS